MFAEKDRPRFSKTGDLGNFDAFIKFKNIFFGKNANNKLAQKKIDYWDKKKNIGIVAKMAVNRYDKLGLTGKLSMMAEQKEWCWQVFKEILT